MMRISIDINADFSILDLFVVRIDPTDRAVSNGEICTYELFSGDGGVERELLTKFRYPYGDGVDLGIEMLNVYQELRKDVA